MTLGGYIATDDAELGNQLMDLVAMRGGILDDARARYVTANLAVAEQIHARRCATRPPSPRSSPTTAGSSACANPSRPDHPDAAVIARNYARPGSIVAFRVCDADELRHRHIAYVLVSCGVLRYALSFAAS
jgi:hypothetical protein